LFEDFATVLVFCVFGIGFVILNIHVLSRVLRTDTPGHVKGLAYECGEPTFGTSFIRFDIRFYVLALIFLIFDVEVVFLVPWAVILKDFQAAGHGLLAFSEAAVFVAILLVGLAYVWKKGDIDWIPKGFMQARAASDARVGMQPGFVDAAFHEADTSDAVKEMDGEASTMEAVVSGAELETIDGEAETLDGSVIADAAAEVEASDDAAANADDGADSEQKREEG
jgi:NADH-quinone oxidoreductase subunit A